MSQQLYFHCLPEDLIAIDEWFHGQGFIFIKPVFLSNESLILESLNDYGSTHGWNVIYITQQSCIDNIFIQKIGDDKLYVNITSPRIFEFSRPPLTLKDNQVHESRLYYCHKKIYDEYYYELMKNILKQFKSHFLTKLTVDNTSFATIDAAKIMTSKLL